MNIKKKNLVLIVIATFVFATLLSCGIFAVVSKSVSFNLALKLDPKIYFALDLQIDYNGDDSYSSALNYNNATVDETKVYRIFNNTNTGAASVAWATVNQNCIVLNQVLAGNILSGLTINSKFAITVTNLTQKISDVEYLHLTLDYDDGQEVFKCDNGYGAVNMEYNVASGNYAAAKSFKLIPQTTLLDGYIQIPFLAEIDGLRHYAQITTANCVVSSTPKTFTLNTDVYFEFAPTINNAEFSYTVTIGGKSYAVNSNRNYFTIPGAFVTGDIVISASATKSKAWDSSLAANFSSGNGSSASPFVINTAEQLALMAYLVNNQNAQKTFADTVSVNGRYNKINVTADNSVTFGTAYYVLNSDIYLNADHAQYKIWESSPPQNSWTPIGNATYKFAGNFNGNNHTIYGIYINKPNASYQGLFGYSTNYIGYVTVKDGFILGSSYIAGISGFLQGSIEYCNSAISVWGGSYIAGLIGWADNSNISYCINHSDIHGRSALGGVTGHGLNAAVYRCANFGDVLVNPDGDYKNGYGNYGDGAAGIVGQYGATEECFNYGNITGYHTVGGLIGYSHGDSNRLGHAINCFNFGKITGIFHVAGIIGQDNGIVEITNCYNASIVLGNAAKQINGRGLATITNCYYLSNTSNISEGVLTQSDIRNQTNFNNWDFEDTWTLSYNANNYYYPMLQWYVKFINS